MSLLFTHDRFLDPDTQALASAPTRYELAAAGGVPATRERVDLIDYTIGLLKKNHLWGKLDWFCIFAAQSSVMARVNWRNPNKIFSAINSPTFVTDRGYSGDAATAYLDAGEVLSAAGNVFALDSACAGVWCNQSGGAVTLVAHLGTGGANMVVRARANAGNETFTINDSTGDVSQANTGSKVGHRASSRTGSAVKRAFFNGVRVANLTTASTVVPASNLYALRNSTSYTSDRIAAVYTGAGLSDEEMALMHEILRGHLTAIGAN